MSRRWQLVATVAGLVAFAAVVATAAGGQQLAGAPSWEPGWALVALVVALAGNNVLCAARWRMLLRPRPTLGDAVRRYSEGIFVAVVVPGGVAGDVYRSAHAGVGGVVADRAVGGLVTLAAAGPALLVLGGGQPLWIAAGAAAFAVLALALVVVRRRLALGRRELAVAAALSVAYLLSFVVVVGALAAAVGVDGGAGWALGAAPLVAVAGMVPSLHGLSPSYAVLGALLAREGAGAGAVTLAAALMLGIQLTAAALGGLSLLARRQGRAVACVSS